MASVPRLRRKRRAKIQGRKRQLRLGRRTGKRGYFKRAAVLGRHARKLTALLKRALSIAPGAPAWGGSKRPVVEVANPIAEKHGLTRTSAKRSETFGNPGSDHYILNLFSYAQDWAKAGSVAAQQEAYYATAREIRKALNGGEHQDYEPFYFEVDGRTYRGQLIAAQHGTGPHLHFGVELVER